jgi:E3 ubiquitin-protein ligase RNF115/126
MYTGNHINQEFTSSMTKSYWCHICKIEFTRIYIDGVEVFCQNCDKSFCEDLSLIENQIDHPSNFVPYSDNSQNSSSLTSPVYSSSSSEASNIVYTFADRNRYSHTPILDVISSLIGSEESRMDNILNYIIQNDLNRYGNPPASKKVVDNLEKFEITNNYLSNKEKINSLLEFDFNCSVCKEEFQLNDKVIKIPCKHIFHQDCILPWLNDRNSCPTCRYELATDDKDYEDRKEKRTNFN